MTRYFLDSEYRPLKAVLLCRPALQIGNAADPGKFLHLRKIDLAAMEAEFRGIIELYKKLKIKSYLLNSQKMPHSVNQYLFNIMFTRDLFFMTVSGAILSRMASVVRRQEPRYAERELKKIGVRIRKVIQGNATFEGADALWINPRLVAVGVGKRTKCRRRTSGKACFRGCHKPSSNATAMLANKDWRCLANGFESVASFF